MHPDPPVNPTVVAHPPRARAMAADALGAGVEAEAGAGLVGDRYHGSRHRHVTNQAMPTSRRPPPSSVAGWTRA